MSPKMRADHKTRFQSKGIGTKYKQKPVGVLLPSKLDEIVRSIPDRSAWLRKVIAEAAEKELDYKPEMESGD